MKWSNGPLTVMVLIRNIYSVNLKTFLTFCEEYIAVGMLLPVYNIVSPNCDETLHIAISCIIPFLSAKVVFLHRVNVLFLSGVFIL